jgi:hypothetical protein
MTDHAYELNEDEFNIIQTALRMLSLVACDKHKAQVEALGLRLKLTRKRLMEGAEP